MSLKTLAHHERYGDKRFVGQKNVRGHICVFHIFLATIVHSQRRSHSCLSIFFEAAASPLLLLPSDSYATVLLSIYYLNHDVSCNFY